MGQARTAKFAIGQIVRHRVFPFRGVVFDVDPIFDNTEEWWLAIPEDVRPSKDQPYYHLFAENAESEYIAYVLGAEPAAGTNQASRFAIRRSANSSTPRRRRVRRARPRVELAAPHHRKMKKARALRPVPQIYACAEASSPERRFPGAACRSCAGRRLWPRPGTACSSRPAGRGARPGRCPRRQTTWRSR